MAGTQRDPDYRIETEPGTRPATVTRTDFEDALIGFQILDKIREGVFNDEGLVWTTAQGYPRSYASLRIKKERLDHLGVESTLDLKMRPVAIGKDNDGSYWFIVAFYREVNGGQTATENDKGEE